MLAEYQISFLDMCIFLIGKMARIVYPHDYLQILFNILEKCYLSSYSFLLKQILLTQFSPFKFLVSDFTVIVCNCMFTVFLFFHRSQHLRNEICPGKAESDLGDLDTLQPCIVKVQGYAVVKQVTFIHDFLMFSLFLLITACLLSV